MFDFDPTAVFIDCITGAIGLGLFMYGKKAQRMPHLIAGLLLMVYPYFTATAAASITVGVLIGLGLWGAMWWGY